MSRITFEPKKPAPEEKQQYLQSSCSAHGCPVYSTITTNHKKFCRYHDGREFESWNEITRKINLNKELLNWFHHLMTISTVEWVVDGLRHRVPAQHPLATPDEDFYAYRHRIESLVNQALAVDAIKNISLKREVVKENDTHVSSWIHEFEEK